MSRRIKTKEHVMVLTRERFVAEAVDGYEGYATRLAAYQHDPVAYSANSSWQIIGSPAGILKALVQYGQATPDSVRAYARLLGQRAGELYEFAQAVPRMNWRHRLRLKVKYALLTWYYRYRCWATWDLGPGTISPFHGVPHLCACAAYRDAHLEWNDANARWRLVRGWPLEEAA